jgi:putative membrane protein
MTQSNGWKLAVVALAVALAGTARAQTPSTGTSPSEPRGSSGRVSDRPDASSTDAGRSSSTATTDDTSKSGSMARGSSDTADTKAQGGKKIDKGLQEKIEKIHAANQAEIHMGQMGAQQAQSPEVKQFAETLQKDHEKADQKLTSAAQQAGIQIEGKAFQKKQDDAMKDMKKLQGKKAEDFDKDFVSRMVKEHEKDLKEVKKAAEDARKANQTELASALEAMTSGMQKHLDEAKRLKDTVDKAGKAQGRRPSDRTGMGPTGTGPSGTGNSGMGTGSTGSPTAPGAPSSTGSPSGQPGPETQGTGTGTKESGAGK